MTLRSVLIRRAVRRVAGSSNPYSLFVGKRMRAAKVTSIKQGAKLMPQLAEAWNGLSAAQKKAFVNQAKTNRAKRNALRRKVSPASSFGIFARQQSAGGRLKGKSLKASMATIRAAWKKQSDGKKASYTAAAARHNAAADKLLKKLTGAKNIE